MSFSYNRLAGRSLERLAALSDGIFGVGMTLLVIDLREPASLLVHSEHALAHGLVALLPQFVTYAMSFLTLGIFWVGQQAQLEHLERSDRHLTWIHLAFLFFVTLMPFSTRLLAHFIVYRTALLAYWANILCLGGVLYASWGYAVRRRLLKPGVPPEVPPAVCRRIQTAQGLYALGAALCVFGTAWSIAFIVVVQLTYAVAPHYRPDP
jgi:TMEM175 potassium channel family protein